MSVVHPLELNEMVRVPMAFEDYLALPEDHRAEYVNGCAVMTPAPVAHHQRIARRIANSIEIGCSSLFVVEASGVWTGERRSRIPDVLATADPYNDHWTPGAPVWVVEVLSPSTRREDMLRKSGEYLEVGVQQYWLADPEERSLVVMTAVDGRWDISAELLVGVAVVAIPGHGEVTLDLADLFRP